MHTHRVSRRSYLQAAALTLSLVLPEFIMGWRVNSTILLSDAKHNTIDFIVISLGAIAAITATHQCGDFSLREKVCAFINCTLLGLVGLGIIQSAYSRLDQTHDVPSVALLMLGIPSLIINLMIVRLLHGHHHDDHNTHVVSLHILSDVAGGALIVVTSVLIWRTGNSQWDSRLSLLLGAGIFLVSLWAIIRVILDLFSHFKLATNS